MASRRAATRRCASAARVRGRLPPAAVAGDAGPCLRRRRPPPARGRAWPTPRWARWASRCSPGWRCACSARARRAGRARSARSICRWRWSRRTLVSETLLVACELLALGLALEARRRGGAALRARRRRRGRSRRAHPGERRRGPARRRPAHLDRPPARGRRPARVRPRARAVDAAQRARAARVRARSAPSPARRSRARTTRRRCATRVNPGAWRGRAPDRGRPPRADAATRPREHDAVLRRAAFRFVARHPAYPLAVAWHNLWRWLDLAGPRRARFEAATIGITRAVGDARAPFAWALAALAALGLAPAHARARCGSRPLALLATTLPVNAETPRFRAPLDPFLILAARHAERRPRSGSPPPRCSPPRCS